MKSLYSATLSLALLWSQSGMSQDTAIDLGTLGGTSSHARGINSVGQIVGASGTAAGESHAFLWEAGVMKDLGQGEARAINEKGDIALTRASRSAEGRTQIDSFLLTHGAETPLASLAGETITQVNALNDQGIAVGSSGKEAVIWTNGVATALPSLGGTSYAAAINNAGWVVGASRSSDGIEHAILWREGVITDLGNLGHGRTIAYGINDAGQIVGESAGKAFIWQDGVISKLETNSSSGYAYAISEAGVIAGKANHWARDYPAVWAPDAAIKELTLLAGSLWAVSTSISDKGWVIGDTTYGEPGDFHPPTSVRATLWK